VTSRLSFSRHGNKRWHIADFTEVIQWYQFFIAVKPIRGLMSRIDEDDYLAEDDQRDSDGSIKVALIGIDRIYRCMEANL
jgi:hypothetical protein